MVERPAAQISFRLTEDERDRVFELLQWLQQRYDKLGVHTPVSQKELLLKALDALESQRKQQEVRVIAASERVESLTAAGVISGKEASRQAVRHGANSLNTAEKWFRHSAIGFSSLSSLRDVLGFVRVHLAQVPLAGTWRECDDNVCACHQELRV